MVTLSRPLLNEWYFFTPRARKYRNGNLPNQVVVGYGYWKATGVEKKIKDNEIVIGVKKRLIFYKGEPTISVKTNWIMHEYTVSGSPRIKRNENDMVVCG